TLKAMGHTVSADTVRSELTKLGFSRRHNRKADEGARHPDRNAQFEYINAKVTGAQAAGQPVISVDTKKKELVGNYKNAGSDYRPKGSPAGRGAEAMRRVRSVLLLGDMFKVSLPSRLPCRMASTGSKWEVGMLGLGAALSILQTILFHHCCPVKQAKRLA